MTASAANASPSATGTSRITGRWHHAVVVGRIAVERVNVIRASALRRILDQHRWSLNSKVRRAAIRRRTTPREVRLGQVPLDVSHLRRSRAIVEDTDPFANEIEQLRLLRRIER